MLLDAALVTADQPGQRFETYVPCGSDSGTGMSVTAFEWMIVALLGLSLPVMLWRKYGLRQVLPLPL